MEASPQASDYAREAGATVTTNPDGSWEAVVRGTDNIRRAVEMQDPARRIEVERGEKLAAGQQRERLFHPSGRPTELPEHLVDTVKRKGFRSRTGAMLTGGWLPNAKDREREAAGEA